MPIVKSAPQLGDQLGTVNVESVRASQPIQARNRALRAPMLFLQAYLAFTVFLFFFGPVKWDIPNPAKLLTFLLVNYSALWVGYAWGIGRGKAAFRRGSARSVGEVRAQPWITRLLVFSMVFTILSCLVRLYSVRGSLGAVIDTLLQPGEAYRQSQAIARAYREGEMLPVTRFAWAFQLTTLFSAFNGLYFPVGLACWHHLRTRQRVLFFITVAVTIIYTLGIGAQSGIGFLVFAALPALAYKVYVSNSSLTAAARAWSQPPASAGRHALKTRLLIAGAIVALVATVVYFQIDRVEASGRDYAPAALSGGFGEPNESGLFRTTGPVSYGIGMLAQYVSHGYEGLALSMELPFEWTYGLGWSKGAQVILHQYLGGPDLFVKSYLFRNEAVTGWPALQFWSTIFPWIASDTTYYGTFIPMLFLGVVFGRCWSRVIVTGNPIGFAVLAQLFTLVLMFPANNAVAQTMEGLFALVGVVAIYLYSIKREKRLRQKWAVLSTIDPGVARQIAVPHSGP